MKVIMIDSVYSTRVRAPHTPQSVLRARNDLREEIFLDDDVILNPSEEQSSNTLGRMASDAGINTSSTNNSRFLRPNRKVHVSTYNVRTVTGHKINGVIALVIKTAQDSSIFKNTGLFTLTLRSNTGTILKAGFW